MCSLHCILVYLGVSDRGPFLFLASLAHAKMGIIINTVVLLSIQYFSLQLLPSCVLAICSTLFFGVPGPQRSHACQFNWVDLARWNIFSLLCSALSYSSHDLCLWNAWIISNHYLL